MLKECIRASRAAELYIKRRVPAVVVVSLFAYKFWDSKLKGTLKLRGGNKSSTHNKRINTNMYTCMYTCDLYLNSK